MDNQNNTNYETVSQEVSDTVAETSSAKFCPNCGTQIKAEEMFCSSCGTNLIDPSNVPLLSKKEKLKNFICEKKKLLIAIALGIVAIAIIWAISFGIMCSVAEDKVVGTWKSEPIYLSKYGGNCVRAIVIEDDGTWLCVGIRVSDGTTVFAESGTWDMEGMDAVLKEEGDPGEAHYKYHLSDKLTNGDTEYERIED